MKPTITTNEYVACIELLAENPSNDYWKFRYDLARMNFDEAAGVDVDAFLLTMAALDCPPEPTRECPWNLNDMPLEQQKKWFDKIPPIAF